MQRAYSLIQFKSVDAEARIVEGIASTPTPDRVGDVMEPKGAKFTLPLPLLWQHKADQPIGKVLSATVTADGIKIRAQLAKGIDFIDKAWALIKEGLVGGLSIGFKPIDYAPMEKGGYRIKTWDWFELSAVTVPMNSQATISMIKSADSAYLAVSGAPKSPAVAGRPTTGKPMNYSERRATAEAERTLKTGDLEALMALDSLTDEQDVTAKSLTSEIERLNSTIKSLGVLEGAAARSALQIEARPAQTIPGQKQTTIVVEEPKLEPGIAFARMALCVLAAQHSTMKGIPLSPEKVAKQWYPSSERVMLAVKTVVAPAVTTDTAWAGTLVYAETVADFVNYLRPRTIIGQFGNGSIPSLNRVPFNMRQVVESGGQTGYWVGQAKPKNVSKGQLTSNTLGFAKVAAITVASDEILKFSNHPTVSAEMLMRNGLTDALVAKIDTSFIDPAFAAVSNVNPASITYNLSPGSSAGNTADDVRTDILANYTAIGVTGLGTTKNIDPRGIVLIMPPGIALSLSLMRTDLGTAEFPGISINGGTLQGIPVLVSNYAALAGYGNIVVAVAAPEINLADDGQVTIDMSREASLELNDSPTQSGTTGVSLVSMWQDNLVAFRAERYITWGLRRAGVVAFLQSVNWGGVGSPT